MTLIMERVFALCPNSFRFSQKWDILLTLAYATTFSQLQNLDLSEDLNEKINQIFQENT